MQSQKSIYDGHVYHRRHEVQQSDPLRLRFEPKQRSGKQEDEGPGQKQDDVGKQDDLGKGLEKGGLIADAQQHQDRQGQQQGVEVTHGFPVALLFPLQQIGQEESLNTPGIESDFQPGVFDHGDSIGFTNPKISLSGQMQLHERSGRRSGTGAAGVNSQKMRGYVLEMECFKTLHF